MTAVKLVGRAEIFGYELSSENIAGAATSVKKCTLAFELEATESANEAPAVSTDVKEAVVVT